MQRYPPLKKQKKRHATCDDAIAAVRWSVEQDGKEVIDVLSPTLTSTEIAGRLGAVFVLISQMVRRHFDKCTLMVMLGYQELVMSCGRFICRMRFPMMESFTFTKVKKSADAGMRCELPSIASKGGSKAATQTDWSSIAGRDVVILPDNDEVGEKFVAKVTTLLHALDPPATVKVVRLKARPPEGGDLADILEQYKEPELVKDAVEGTAARVLNQRKLQSHEILSAGAKTQQSIWSTAAGENV